MTLQDHLNKFYFENNIPKEGGVNFKTFEVTLPFFSLTLPNFSWRKKMLHIHDLEHILNQQNTTWEGEMFIASWEISTGFWKHFPVCIFPLWTMGWGVWKHPTAVFNGFEKGNNDRGIAELKIQKEQLLAYDLSQLQQYTLNKNRSKSLFVRINKLTLWLLITQIVFLSPLLFIISLLAIAFS